MELIFFTAQESKEIVGVKKFAYDIWGDTVNTATRMEQNSQKGKLNISGSTYNLVKDSFIFEQRGKVEVKVH